MDFAAGLRIGLQEVLVSGPVEIRESAGRITPVAPLLWEVRGAVGKPLLQVWAEKCNVTPCVVAIPDRSGERILLAVERLGHAELERLEIVRLNFKRILAGKFRDETVEKLSGVPDLGHFPSRMYARGISRNGASRCAVIPSRTQS